MTVQPPNTIMTAKHGMLKSYNMMLKAQLEPKAQPVYARISVGRWIADCHCGGAELLDPDNPKFYCCSCNNRGNDGKARPVIFPNEAERKLIEAYLLQLRDDNLPIQEKYQNWQPKELHNRYFMAEIPQDLLDKFGTLEEYLESHLKKEG